MKYFEIIVIIFLTLILAGVIWNRISLYRFKKSISPPNELIDDILNEMDRLDKEELGEGFKHKSVKFEDN